MKIICSIGPAVKSFEDLDLFVESGMNSMRLNFSHIDYEKAKSQIQYVKQKYSDIDIIQDLQGSKLRVSKLFKGEKKVISGDENILFCTESEFPNLTKFASKYTIVPISVEGDFDLLSVNKIFMKDNTMEFKKIGTAKSYNLIKVRVILGGIIRAEKGLNIPEISRQNMSLSQKDKKDIIFGLENNVNFICLSYASKPEDIVELKDYIKELKKNNKSYKTPKILAKIECKEGIENFDQILKLVDGIMIGRGDLCSEIDLLDIPKIQNEIIEKIRKKNVKLKNKKEIIIATHILGSMKNNIVPTINEINDIYNFAKSDVSAIMLATEVSVGRNPSDVIITAKKIINSLV